MEKEEPKEMVVSTPTINDKKSRVIAEAKEKYNNKNVETLIRAGGSFTTSHKFDAVEVSKDLRGKS